MVVEQSAKSKNAFLLFEERISVQRGFSSVGDYQRVDLKPTNNTNTQLTNHQAITNKPKPNQPNEVEVESGSTQHT